MALPIAAAAKEMTSTPNMVDSVVFPMARATMPTEVDSRTGRITPTAVATIALVRLRLLRSFLILAFTRPSI
jgi:hypothetical protein